MKIVCIGGGPAGVYFAICMKLRGVNEVTIVERNDADYVQGWGIVLSEKIIEKMIENDPESGLYIKNLLTSWQCVSVYFKGARLHYMGNHFSAMGRKQLLTVLRDRARSLGVDFLFNKSVLPEEIEYLAPDLIVASDGATSKIRQVYSNEFKIQIENSSNKYLWLGTTKNFKKSISFIFEETKHGMVWAHCYQFDDCTSTFLVECSARTWHEMGLDLVSEKETLRIFEKIFYKHLDNAQLISNYRQTDAYWRNFSLVKCKRWYHKNIVLVGDAAHTTHFSIGSGTRLALDDALTLAEMLYSNNSLETALQKYQDFRETQLKDFETMSFNSMSWFENLEKYTDYEPIDFAYALLTRAKIVNDTDMACVIDKQHLGPIKLILE